jgi:hypothetical protein
MSASGSKETANQPPGSLQSFLGCINELAIPMSQMRFPPKLAKLAADENFAERPLF